MKKINCFKDNLVAPFKKILVCTIYYFLFQIKGISQPINISDVINEMKNRVSIANSIKEDIEYAEFNVVKNADVINTINRYQSKVNEFTKEPIQAAYFAFINFEEQMKKVASKNVYSKSYIDTYYNLFYKNTQRDNSQYIPYRKTDYREQSSWTSFTSFKGNDYQVDESSGLIFLINSNGNQYYLNVFQINIGAMTFDFDDDNGHLFLPGQNKKVKLTGINATNTSGYTLRVYNSGGETKTVIEDRYFPHIFELAKHFVNDPLYSDNSKLHSMFSSIITEDEKNTKKISYKYIPSYEEKLSIFRIGGLPKSDLDNPDFFIIKNDEIKSYKSVVYGLGGGYHFLNNYFESLRSTFGNYFIFKKNGKYGIIDATMSTWKTINPIKVNNIYDMIEYNTGTQTFKAIHNGKGILMDVNGLQIK